MSNPLDFLPITNLMVTADDASGWGGGSQVVSQEWAVLQSLGGHCELWDRKSLAGGSDPWGWDDVACSKVADPPFCHVYSGSFPKFAWKLKRNGGILTWTIAAHDREVSKWEHEKLGFPFPYPHLVEKELWNKYIEGYRLADVIICPSTVAERTVRNYGVDFQNKRIEVIPHGCDLPEQVLPLPSRFVLGYMGSIGVDKGLVYLLQAWKKLHYPDAMLRIAGRDSGQLLPWVKEFGGGSVHLAGWQDSISDFYAGISCYVQPSATEGFGMEVLESMAHGRPVICSDGAGAVDLVDEGINGRKVPACNVDELASAIDDMKRHADLQAMGEAGRETAAKYTWETIRGRYAGLWRSIL